jgi:D12 class N6 adenine-specific DNA methyltransferase
MYQAFDLENREGIGARVSKQRKPPARANITEQPYPHFIKYMGSKSKIMGFVLGGVNEVYEGGSLCDLFAGSASLAGAVRQQVPVHSNDIQAYSGVLADTYLKCFKHPGLPTANELISYATEIADRNASKLGMEFDYQKLMLLSVRSKCLLNVSLTQTGISLQKLIRGPGGLPRSASGLMRCAKWPNASKGSPASASSSLQ